MILLKALAQRLTQYEEQEAQSIIRLLLLDCFGMTFTDICCGGISRLSNEEKEKLEGYVERLSAGEPVQYVTTKAFFRDLEFHVEPGVLIPRPETETLIQSVVDYGNDRQKQHPSLRILDIGTGSGCIAITLAKELKGSDVEAWDISPEALSIATENAERNDVKVSFRKQDILNINNGGIEFSDHSIQGEEHSNSPVKGSGHYDVVVSNPPYICRKEAEEMEKNVLDYEPSIALFVPDDDPLLFYRHITHFAKENLVEGGLLAFEINPLYVNETVALLKENKFEGIEIHMDDYGKQRVVIGKKK